MVPYLSTAFTYSACLVADFTGDMETQRMAGKLDCPKVTSNGRAVCGGSHIDHVAFSGKEADAV